MTKGKNKFGVWLGGDTEGWDAGTHTWPSHLIDEVTDCDQDGSSAAVVDILRTVNFAQCVVLLLLWVNKQNTFWTHFCLFNLC